MKFFILLLTLIILPVAQAESWKNTSFREDDSFQYWTGLSSEQESEKSALEEAYQEALNQAAKYNFGFKHQVIENTYANKTEHKVHQETQWQSEKVLFKGVKPLRQEVKKINNKYQAYREISYPKSEILKEKSRLDAMAAPEAPVPYKIKATSSYGLLKIQTNIPQAKATLTKSTSPESLILNIPGELTLATGVYYLHAEKEGYSDVKQEIIVSGGENLTNLNFETSLGTLSLKVSPENAEVRLNHMLIKGNKFDIPKGNYKIEVSHPDFFTQSEEFELLNGEGVYREITLKPKKGAISIYSNPSQAEIFINGNRAGTTPLVGYQLLSDSKELEIILVKEGYNLQRKTLEFKPNKSLPPIDFNLSKKYP